MQQTETYKLNLIETSDTFSPNPLNENAQKLEAAILAGDAAVRADTAAGDAALEQRIVNLEGKHAVGGTYVGTGGAQTIQLGFTPVVVFIFNSNTRFAMFNGVVAPTICQMVEGGFSANDDPLGSFNFKGSTYMFIAIG